MPCKHEGGTDKCAQNKTHQCFVWRKRYMKKWYKDNPEYNKQYKKDHIEPGIDPRATIFSGGKAAELLVEADLLMRGLIVTRPSNPEVPDDLHARISGRWFTFQVKAVQTNRKSGRLAIPSRWKISSDILVLVTGRGTRIEYRAAGKKVPRVLTT